MSLLETSKLIALILRHRPEVIGITLDEHGWANVDELIAGIAKQQPFDLETLVKIVDTDEHTGIKPDLTDLDLTTAKSKATCDEIKICMPERAKDEFSAMLLSHRLKLLPV